MDGIAETLHRKSRNGDAANSVRHSGCSGGVRAASGRLVGLSQVLLLRRFRAVLREPVVRLRPGFFLFVRRFRRLTRTRPPCPRDASCIRTLLAFGRFWHSDASGIRTLLAFGRFWHSDASGIRCNVGRWLHSADERRVMGVSLGGRSKAAGDGVGRDGAMLIVVLGDHSRFRRCPALHTFPFPPLSPFPENRVI